MNEEPFYRALRRSGVPEHLHDGVVRYAVHRVLPGRFLSAVLANDLRQAFAFGDEQSLLHLETLVRFFYNALPAAAWGSPDHVTAWVERHDERSTDDAFLR